MTARQPSNPNPRAVIGGNGPIDDGFQYETREDIPRDVKSMHWAPMDIQAILRVLREMPLDERGFFVTALFAMYECMEPLPADPQVARLRLGIDVRSYKHHLKRALDRGVLKTRPTGRISNTRYEEEITKWVASETRKKSEARSKAATEREARKRATPEQVAKIAADLSENANKNSGSAPQDDSGDRADVAPMSPRSRADVAPMSPRSQVDLSENAKENKGSRHTACSTEAQRSCTQESNIESTHTQTPPPTPRDARADSERVCSEIPNLLPDPVRVTKDQPDPRKARSDEKDLGNYLFESEREIRHPSFTISLEALTMQLVTANLGLSTNEARDVARKTALANATQWAAEIANGKLSQDVLPYNIPSALRASVVKQRQKQRERTPAGAGAAPAYLRR